ncbi:MAG: O-antigen ligase family protein [Cyclobacteriaceae bacterium]|nr:O-antigen ligase family protein [Cyclobacteriaceae bacterium]
MVFNRHLTKFYSKIFSIELLYRVAICTAFFVIPLWQKISIKLILLAIVIGIITQRSNFSFRLLFRRSWDLWIFFGILLVGLLWTSNLAQGLRSVETMATLVVVPIALSFVGPDDQKTYKSIIHYFIAGVFLASLICLVASFIAFLRSGDTDVFYYYSFTEIINSHPTYHAYYIIFSLTILLDTIFNGTSKLYSLLIGFGVLFLFVILILTSGQTSFAGLLLVFSYFILKSILEPLNARRWLVVLLISVMTISLMIIYTNYYYNNISNDGDYWERINLWRAGIMTNTNPWIGVGTGDYLDALNSYYLKNGLDKFAEENYNAHNQFIHTFLTHGILGLLTLLIIWIRPLYTASKNYFVLGLLLFFPLIVYGFNEVILGRYQGIVFISFLHQFVIWKNDRSKL